MNEMHGFVIDPPLTAGRLYVVKLLTYDHLDKKNILEFF